MYSLRFFFFFFFQAEDGIRDVAVTGVQTCALPIFGSRGLVSLEDLDLSLAEEAARGVDLLCRQQLALVHGLAEHRRRRSEEHTSELQSRLHLVCRLLLEKKKNKQQLRVHYQISTHD